MSSRLNIHGGSVFSFSEKKKKKIEKKIVRLLLIFSWMMGINLSVLKLSRIKKNNY